MTFLHFFAQLWRRGSWKGAADQIAAEALEALWPRISTQIQFMGPSQRYGYIRAHGRGLVATLTANAQLYRELGVSAKREFQHVVLERVIELALARFTRLALPRSMRRAA